MSTQEVQSTGFSLHCLQRSAVLVLCFSGYLFSASAFAISPIDSEAHHTGDVVDIHEAAGLAVGQDALSERIASVCSEIFPEHAWLMQYSYQIRLAEMAELNHSISRHIAQQNIEGLKRAIDVKVKAAVDRQLPPTRVEQEAWCREVAALNMRPLATLNERFPNALKVLQDDLAEHPLHFWEGQKVNFYVGCIKKNYERRQPVEYSVSNCSCISRGLESVYSAGEIAALQEAFELRGELISADVNKLTGLARRCLQNGQNR